MSRSIYARYAWPMIIFLVLSLPLVLWGVKGAFEGSNNHVSQWLPQDYEETRTYQRFRRLFGADDFALVSWEDCTLDDRRLEQFARQVVPLPGQDRKDDAAEWFEAVITGQRVLERLIDVPFELPREEALRRLEGSLVGADHQTTCALVILSEAGDRDRTAALAALKKIAIDDCGLDPDQLRFGGDAVINAAIDIESERAISQWIGLSWLVALAVAWRCLRSIKLVAMVFIVAGYASGLGTAAIYYTGGTMNLVLVVVPVLIYVLTLSASVHLTNYYRDAIRESGVAGAPARAVAAGWTPCALSAITTALGLISLYVSHILPVKMFGLYSALGILLGLPILFLWLPAMMETWPLGGSRTVGAWSLPHRWLRRSIVVILRRRRLVMGICLLLLAFSCGGVALTETSIAPGRFFAARSRWFEDTRWLQERIGALVPFEVVLHFDNECPMTFLERMELVRHVEEAVRSIDLVGGTISAATFGPVFDSDQASGGEGTQIGPTGRVLLKIMGIRNLSTMQRRILNKRLVRHRQHFADTGYLHLGRDEESWRISARVNAFVDVDYDQFLAGARGWVDRYLKRRLRGDAGVRAEYTGVVPLVFVAQRELLSGLFKSFCLAFGLIAVVMVFVLRSVRAGLLVMLPNVFPALVTFGTMGWLGMVVDVGAMMTASVALGIAVDDTLHFLTWFRRALRQGRSRRQAITEAYGRCALAMTQTTLIAGLGLLVYYLSSFQPVSQFGLLMFILLVAALVGDLVLLPAMLATRLGKLFERNNGQSSRNRVSLSP